ncbi:MAG: hypothetical protein AAFR87_08020 [Bacteroidota bacterium]
MKSIITGLLSLFVLTACTVPSPSDFESANSPLGKDEFITMWRIPGKASAIESINQDSDHLNKMDQILQPFFQQLITRIFKDAKDGKLKIQESEDLTDLEEKVIEDLPSRMGRRFGASYQNLSPFMGAMHITQKRKVNGKGFPSTELELMLIEQDPHGQSPEAFFGSVLVSDLMELDYSFEIKGNTYTLISFLDRYNEFVYPIFFKSTDQEAGLRSLDQAFDMKEIVLEGKWNSVEWLGGEPNLTQFKSIDLSKKEMETHTGTYIFKAGEGSFLNQADEDVAVSFEIEGEHINVSWNSEGPFYGFDIFPSSKEHFFTVYGDEFLFYQTKDGKSGLKLTDSQGKESVAVKE